MKIADFVGFILAVTVGIVVAIVYTHHKTAETINVDRMSNSSLHIQCEDEHEPVVTKLANSTEIVVTCEVK